MARKSGFGGQLPNSRRVGNPKPHSISLSIKAKLVLGMTAIAVGCIGIIWVTDETLEGKEQEAVLSLTATAVYKECARYYNQLNAQMERLNLPPFATGNDLKEYCEEWATNPPGFNK